VRVVRHPFAGHVFNLDTVGGWYIGNGIVTHNCRCAVIPYLASEMGLEGEPVVTGVEDLEEG